MGIKDKVLDILFDDNDEQDITIHQEQPKQNKKNVNASSFLDTGSIFIDATSPLPKAKPAQNSNTIEQESHEPKVVGESGYQMSENISPIFGPIDGKNKKNKNLSKIKSYNDISNKTFDTDSKKQTPTYTSVVISPIYGPISNKPAKKSSKPRKKTVDPFDRDINDTGSFDTVLSEEDEVLEPQFEEADTQDTSVEEALETSGDTDRLVRISDKINRIKNEAANIYSDSEDTDTISEDDNQVETVEPSTISCLIHDVQNHDEKIVHKPIINEEPEVVEEPQETVIQPEETSNNVYITPDSNNDIFDEPSQEISEPVIQQDTGSIETFEDTDQSDDFVSNKPNNEAQNTTPETPTSVDDLFEDEDVEEGKDLFSVLFGDD